MGWYGSKRIAGYAREACPRARLRAARGARPQATIDVPTAQALQVIPPLLPVPTACGLLLLVLFMRALV